MHAAQNHLVELLPRVDRQRLLAACEPVDLQLGEVLCERGDAVHHVYFPIDGFISLLMQSDHHPSLEVGMVGREGMVGAALLLGVGAEPLQALVQGAGSTLRMSKEAFDNELDMSPTLRRVVGRFVFVRLSQMAGLAACMRFHLIGQRLARWLLMSQDRAHAAQFHVTHEFLAAMLGVRRVGITAAAGELARQGLITYHRGELTVLDRTGLERASCACYAADRSIYREHLA
ncbi:MAG: Crp/Fnr family transcriptional regulator [Rubrivivax sp.]|nr:Crp/Fnr family transcriptional regulator [Rubrivivax sp.]